MLNSVKQMLKAKALIPSRFDNCVDFMLIHTLNLSNSDFFTKKRKNKEKEDFNRHWDSRLKRERERKDEDEQKF